MSESHTRLCSVAGYGHGLCVYAAEHADIEADSKPVTVPQWALVCGRYVCVHICTDVGMCVHMSVVWPSRCPGELEAPE